MPNAYPREFRERAVELVIRSGRPINQVAKELGVSATGLQRRVAQAPTRRHSAIGYRSPADYEKINTQATELAV